MSRTSRLSLSIVLAALVAAVAPMPAQARNVNVRSSARVNVNSNRNVHVDRNRNVNVHSNRNVNVDIDRDVHVHGGYYEHDYHPAAVAAAVTATTMVTAAALGSRTYALPPGCSMVMVNGFAYQQCGATWYQPQLSGSSTTYVVVTPPR